MHEHLEAVASAGRPRPPDAVDEVALGDDAPGPRHELGEQLALARPEHDGGAPRRAQLERALVELEAEGAQRPRLLDGPGPAADGPDAGEQLLGVKGLHEVVVGSGVEPGHPVGHRVAGGDEDHRGRVAGLPHAAQHVKAAHDGQHDVQEHAVVDTRGGELSAAPTVRGHVGRPTLAPEYLGDRLGEPPRVLDHENPHASPFRLEPRARDATRAR